MPLTKTSTHKNLIVALIVLGALAIAAFSRFDANMLRQSQDSVWSYARFLNEAAKQNCLRREHLIFAAIKRGWVIDEDPITLRRAQIPNGTTSSLLIVVDPPLPFLLTANKEIGEIFFFNDQGCLL